MGGLTLLGFKNPSKNMDAPLLKTQYELFDTIPKEKIEIILLSRAPEIYDFVKQALLQLITLTFSVRSFKLTIKYLHPPLANYRLFYAPNSFSLFLLFLPHKFTKLSLDMSRV